MFFKKKKYETIETHARAFLPFNISAIDSVLACACPLQVLNAW